MGKADGKAIGISRRSLIEGGIAAAALIATGGVTAAFGQSEEALRPPGGQNPDRLWEACIRCDRCRAACPTNAIGVESLSSNIIGARLPVMKFRDGYCTMCDGEYRCIQACPTGALCAFDPHADKIGLAVVDEKECQLYGYSGTCAAPCVDSCPWNALSLDDAKRLVVDERRCNGCGACEQACPTNAYGNYDGTSRRGINVEVFHG